MGLPDVHHKGMGDLKHGVGVVATASGNPRAGWRDCGVLSQSPQDRNRLAVAHQCMVSQAAGAEAQEPRMCRFRFFLILPTAHI